MCSKITDKAFDFVSLLKNLDILHVGSCQYLSDAGVKKFSTLTKLTALNLEFCPNLTPQSIQSLPDSLEILNIKHNQNVTHESLKQLTNLKKLNAVGTSQIFISIHDVLPRLEKVTLA
jgi:hypothetical protein